ncbi:Sex peptide receptor [Orchesella cincta]|uniref:Sex peptide receptor n=1 Tax=Orchesella cincta TaxID=48709 RepID=A0A1D2ME57_ORCCI|nr:Sex peptide receptor [Orchesella cincta]
MEEATSEFPLFALNTIYINETFDAGNASSGTGTDSSFGYCDTYLKPFAKSYSTLHGYNSLIICLFGVHANILNLIVLSRKEMRNPTNAILTGLAVADLANMILLPKTNSYEWAAYVLIHSNFSQVLHTTSIWLAVTLAVWRYVMVTRYRESKIICSMKRAQKAVIAAYIFSVVLCTPIYFSFAVKPIQNMGDKENSPIYVVNVSDLAIKYPMLKTTNFWLYSVVIKMIPCAIFTILFMPHIFERQGGRASFSFEAFGSDSTTRMLLAILFLFLIAEFPQGLLGLMSGVLGDEFFNSCYIPLGDLMDFVALLNSSINFILYCTMSEKFRETFVKVFRLNGIARLFRRQSTSRIMYEDTHTA